MAKFLSDSNGGFCGASFISDDDLDGFVANKGGRKAALKRGGRRTAKARGRKTRGKAEAEAQAYVNSVMSAEVDALTAISQCYFE